MLRGLPPRIPRAAAAHPPGDQHCCRCSPPRLPSSTSSIATSQAETFAKLAFVRDAKRSEIDAVPDLRDAAGREPQQIQCRALLASAISTASAYAFRQIDPSPERATAILHQMFGVDDGDGTAAADRQRRADALGARIRQCPQPVPRRLRQFRRHVRVRQHLSRQSGWPRRLFGRKGPLSRRRPQRRCSGDAAVADIAPCCTTRTAAAIDGAGFRARSGHRRVRGLCRDPGRVLSQVRGVDGLPAAGDGASTASSSRQHGDAGSLYLVNSSSWSSPAPADQAVAHRQRRAPSSIPAQRRR